MSNYLRLEEMAGGNAYIEVAGEGLDNDEISSDSFLTKKISNTLEDVIGVAKKSFESMAQLEVDEVEVEFGIKVGVCAGLAFWMITQASGESSIKVKAKWHPREK